MPVTDNDDIYFADGNTLLSIENISSATATSVQNALDKRKVYTYRWDSSAEKIAQTGMREGDNGYNTADNAEYLYNGSSWLAWNKRKTSYVPNISSFALTTSLTDYVGYYSISSGICTVEFSAILGATGANTGITSMFITLPPFPVVTRASFLTNNIALQGTAFFDVVAGVYLGCFRYSTGGTTANILAPTTTAGKMGQVAPTIPAAWAANDICSGSFSYPVA
jgi:hypothetical protein